MLPLYHDPWFAFRFGGDRIIPRLHIEGVQPGSHVSVIKINPATGERLGLLATAIVGEGGWVDLPQSIIMKSGEAFIRSAWRADGPARPKMWAAPQATRNAWRRWPIPTTSATTSSWAGVARSIRKPSTRRRRRRG